MLCESYIAAGESQGRSVVTGDTATVSDRTHGKLLFYYITDTTYCDNLVLNVCNCAILFRANTTSTSSKFTAEPRLSLPIAADARETAATLNAYCSNPHSATDLFIDISRKCTASLSSCFISKRTIKRPFRKAKG